MLIISVLARPGTPSSRLWPPAKTVMSSSSSTSRWPTMTLPNSVEHALVQVAAGRSQLFVRCLVESWRGSDRRSSCERQSDVCGELEPACALRKLSRVQPQLTDVNDSAHR